MCDYSGRVGGSGNEGSSGLTMVHKKLDAQKLYELGSHPGTFPEMVESVYHAGLEAGKEEEREEATK